MALGDLIAKDRAVEEEDKLEEQKAALAAYFGFGQTPEQDVTAYAALWDELAKQDKDDVRRVATWTFVPSITAEQAYSYAEREHTTYWFDERLEILVGLGVTAQSLEQRDAAMAGTAPHVGAIAIHQPNPFPG